MAKIKLAISILALYFIGQPAGFSQISGYTRGGAYGLGESYEIGHAYAELGLTADYRMGQTRVFGEARMLTGMRFGESYTDLQLREAYASWEGTRVSLHFGSQIIKWGRADGFNPTGNLLRSDYFFLTADPEDQLLGTVMARANWRITPQIELEVIGIPYYQPSTYRYDLFDFGANAYFADPALPEAGWKQGALAGRLNFDLPAIGFSFSGFRGYDPFYGFSIATIYWNTGMPVIAYEPKPYQKTTIGADFAIPAGVLIIRGEVAWNLTDKAQTDIHIPDTHLHYVLGLEAGFAGITAILQYTGKFNPDYTEPVAPVLLNPADPMAQLDYTNQLIAYQTLLYNQNVFGLTKKVNHGLSLTLTGSFAYDVLQPELTVYYLPTTEEFLIRPKISYRISDGLTLAVGAHYMDGKDATVFDYAGKVMSGGFVELKASF